MTRFAWIISLFLVAAAPRIAHAIEDPDTQLARTHYDAGTRLYASGDYSAALKEFREGWIAKKRPAFQFNIARCYERLGDRPNAIDAYKQYLASNPPDKADITTRISELEEKQKEEERLAAQSLTTGSKPAPKPMPTADAGDSNLMSVDSGGDDAGSSKKWWIVGGVVAGVLVVGAVVTAVLLSGGTTNANLKPGAVMVTW